MDFLEGTLDFELSPYSGLTRESWIAAGKFLLDGIFKHISSPDQPVVLPRIETAVSYPHPGGSKAEEKAEIFEGLARSFLLAAPLIHIEPELYGAKILLREYYKSHILRLCTPGDPCYALSNQELAGGGAAPGVFRTFQQTVETCALVICLEGCREEIWETYSRAERDQIAAFLSGYAHGNTVPQNWRFFNMLVLAFLDKEGYPVDKEVMAHHAQAVLSYYAGDGWYRDGHSFDYYSCWAFQVYGPIWSRWYGYQNEPYYAKQFEAHSNRLMETYPDFFDKEGYTMMWGRSCIYRNAVTSAFGANMMLENSAADPGLARRIASGSLLQFLKRDDFLHDGIPTLGFYGQFTPLIQSYSCAESTLWIAKAFLCLELPPEHPFWTAKEHNGSWERLAPKAVKVTALNGPALCFSNHEANGETILRTGKVVKKKGDENGIWNYGKLCYNSKYPWEAAKDPRVEAQQYVLEDLAAGRIEKTNVTLWGGEEDRILYRRQFFEYEMEKESHWMHALGLADFPVPCGILRVDKLRTYKSRLRLTLGSYGFPDNGTKTTYLEEGRARAVILKGRDYCGREKQMAMTLYDGWEALSLIHSEGTNPDSEKSITAYGSLSIEKLYGDGPYILISQVITKESHEEFQHDEIFPIARVAYADADHCGGYGPVTIYLKNKTVRVVDFSEAEGRLQM